jgi:hypothetical protein
MTGQISGLSLELVAVVVAASMLVGAVDILRQPGWAWKQAGEPQIAYLILDLLLPLIGVGMYVFRARPKVVAEVAAGAGPEPAPAPPAKPAQRQTELDQPRTEPAQPRSQPAQPEKRAKVSAAIGTDPFTSFREVAANDYATDPGTAGDDPSPEKPEQFTISSTFFSTGASSRSLRHPVALARAYRPRQRTSLSEDLPDQTTAVEPEQAHVGELEPDQAHVGELDPEPVDEAAPVGAVEPEPVGAVEPEPERAVEPEPVGAVEPEPVGAVEPEPVGAVEPEPVAVIAQYAPTVPSGWKVDPTGRHQFRYWDGFHWTENVADDGEESLDAVSA